MSVNDLLPDRCLSPADALDRTAKDEGDKTPEDEGHKTPEDKDDKTRRISEIQHPRWAKHSEREFSHPRRGP